jgi:DNA invertase Pin-like site-specific DNA recombinase
MRDNMRDCRDKGRLGEKRRLGVTNGSTKVTHETARAIREARARGASRREVAEQYGVSVWTVTQVTSNRDWTCTTTGCGAGNSSSLILEGRDIASTEEYDDQQ